MNQLNKKTDNTIRFSKSINVNYDNEKEALKTFLRYFMDGQTLKYMEQIHNRDIKVEISDIVNDGYEELANNILDNTWSYLKLLYSVIDEIMYDEEIIDHSDVFIQHRISRFKEKYPEGSVANNLGFLIRNYSLTIINDYRQELSSIRELKADKIGKFVTIRGIVTKISKVQPSIKVATYICEFCGTETYQEITGDIFDILEECNSEKCIRRKVKGALCLISRGSKFSKYQSLQVQEISSDVPHGSIPRTINIESFNCETDCRPGDLINISGISMPKMFYGLKKLKLGLLNDNYLLLLNFQSIKTDNVIQNNMITDCILTGNEALKQFAPEIYGMNDIKKILLLMLISSPNLIREDGIKIRGNINVMLIGEPGVAKSQMLKFVSRISERSVYTTGRGASGVGLTVSVTKDPLTKEILLEGGALVLADNGICCIDELDKMNEVDRISIHEVMEQQTITISKAGINTTLNARCSILAAANPIKNKYDHKKPMESNINLPISLLSRFDIIFIIKDNHNNHTNLAAHITNLHKSVENDSQSVNNNELLRSFIKKVRKINPQLNRKLKEKIVNNYIKIRNNRNITPRFILSIIRLSIANARFRVSEEVTEEDVNEAFRLLTLSFNETDNIKNVKHSIYNFIISKAINNKIDLNHLYSDSPFDKEKLDSCINDFCNTGLWVINEDSIEIL
ncbi:MCM7 [Hepatospora eriocheir]|uniref:DNA replication licensing factor MCM7 n=1 Tax=Hepatospora eriocheir TaxID=1081669 RepID=A0A1X0Q969_9MICR|nr:MCM7 [Hepatospora eriocheir]